MSRIVWDRPQDRKFEAGVEKGVFYYGNNTGVPWNGLISVNEKYIGGDLTPKYQDGINTHHHVPGLEFEAEIIAYTYPSDLDMTMGFERVRPGLRASGQLRRGFGMTYQTREGNASDPRLSNVKIHLIYNAFATPNPIDRVTLSDIDEPVNFSWNIKTTPVPIPGYDPSAHFILEPDLISPNLRKNLLDQLYGAPGVRSRLLSPIEILDTIDNWRALYPSSTTYPSSETTPGAP